MPTLSQTGLSGRALLALLAALSAPGILLLTDRPGPAPDTAPAVAVADASYADEQPTARALAQHADLAVLGRVIDVTSTPPRTAPDGLRIHGQLATVEVRETFTGPQRQTVTVRRDIPELDGRQLSVAGEPPYEIGQQVLLLLTERSDYPGIYRPLSPSARLTLDRQQRARSADATAPAGRQLQQLGVRGIRELWP
ncbi:hypothetical protein GKE82_24040 [Conexibacter sp. W3-3-2]|uniref:hypothetical protein n=1 Tax=Conexibacter sp. W3-3-2 TaxID=2675227 RepID=UPI0012B8108B|nr:hypothetical protein [Conexibacter sp. W3-3-2]MTD47279.1 hypothetical protein [Conexibacter sp. W3-3-2]